MAAPILFCSDPLNVRRVDEHFAAEADTVRAAGGVVALVDHDALLGGDADAAVRRVPRDLGLAWYRGWMIPTDRYQELSQALAGRGAGLLVSPDDYGRAHELPGWYDTFADVTPRSVWMPTEPGVVPSAEDLASLIAPLGRGPAVVKDYVKSRKHDWDEACYLPDLTDVTAVHRVVSRFVQLQDDSLAGGIVVRAFEPFVTSGTDAGEARVWWLDGQPILIGAHPDTPDQQPQPDLTRVQPLVTALGCRFVTTDLARRTDGAWRVVEVGDGQVSDLPRTVNPAQVVNPLLSTGR
ncbi:MAG: hypothetical protein JWP76_1117 [Dactylosporangium sp.]|nr:hypothetical protein [Dactylosporangium sp.]